MNRYRFLLIDADDTLLDFLACERQALLSVLGKYGIPGTEENVRLYSAFNDAMWKKLERGEVTKPRLRVARFEQFVEALGVPVNAAALAEDYEHALGGVVRVFPGVEASCALLAKEYRMFIVTNGLVDVQERRLAASGLLPYFEGVFISGKIGYDKPKKEFFDAVAASIDGFDPGRTLIIGDSLTSDIAGAARCGFDSCWVRRGKTPPGGAEYTYCTEDFNGVPALLSGIGKDKE